jgi:antitoxin component YwqK of YwqJK toxin-antitoxin module
MVEEDAFRMHDSTLFTVRDSLKNGWFISYTPEKGIYKKVSTGIYKNGLQQEVDTLFFPSGKVYLTRTFVDGEENGQRTEFYENGRIKEQGQLRDIYKEELWTYNDSAGNLIKTVNYLHNNMSGEYHDYYRNGQLKSKGTYIVIRFKNKVKPKAHKIKSFSGSGYGISPYLHLSFKDGTWLYYSETGQLKTKLTYSKGHVK